MMNIQTIRNKDSKAIWVAVIAVAVASIFIIYYDFKVTNMEIHKLAEENKKLSDQVRVAKLERDSARYERARMALHLYDIANHNLMQDNRITDVMKAFGLEEDKRKNYIDEKDYIPNVDASKHAGYMSEYEYKEY